jgi:hypothetical protein
VRQQEEPSSETDLLPLEPPRRASAVPLLVRLTQGLTDRWPDIEHLPELQGNVTAHDP